jgi:cation diffusion facilitator family transporter
VTAGDPGPLSDDPHHCAPDHHHGDHEGGHAPPRSRVSHDHRGETAPPSLVPRFLRGHSHDHAESVDQALLVSKAGTRALWISLIGLLVTAAVQGVVVVVSGSIGLLADTIHNASDALTAVPIGLAFVIGRRPPTRRYTYGYGRAEDLAGLAVVVVVALSAGVAGWEAIARFVHPHAVSHLWIVGIAGAVGFAGNELAARYRIGVGRRIGSVALIADGKHARTDGFTSLGVVAGAIGVGAGWRLADPIVGLLISVAILAVLRSAVRDVYRRLMDATDPETVERIQRAARAVGGVLATDHIRVRWVGHELHAAMDLTVPSAMSIGEAHATAELVHHRLLHEIPRLADVTIHTNPTHDRGSDPHALTAHHRQGRA